MTSNRTHAAMVLRQILPFTYTSFFGKFGRFTPAQEKAIPLVLEGHSVVLSAPTAMGKTEAIVAPVAERAVTEKWEKLSVIYVVPTRALANDIYLRIEGPLRELNLKTEIKHGDRPGLNDMPPNWLVTTPESLDSLLCRKTDWLSTLRTVIVDEVHLLDNTYRGDQLRILLDRLRKIAKPDFIAVHMLSATIPNPHEVAQRYVTDYELVQIAGQRDISPSFVKGHEEVKALARANGWKKLLYFCNTRRGVEETVNDLQSIWKPYPVVPHHGSLDRRVREETEKVMKENRVAVCVATMTLEIGVDIGDIDLVVLSDPPWSIAALQQRVGRGGRRANTINAAALCRTDEEQIVMESMFDAAAQGLYSTIPYKTDLSVIVQQTLSYVFQCKGGVPKLEVVELLAPLADTIIVEVIVRHLEKTGWTVERLGRLFPSTQLLDLAEKGEIHSNVPQQGNLNVIDVASGRSIGRVSGIVDSVFCLAGATWKVVRLEGSKLLAARVHVGRGGVSFSTRHNTGGFHSLLPADLQK